MIIRLRGRFIAIHFVYLAFGKNFLKSACNVERILFLDTVAHTALTAQESVMDKGLGNLANTESLDPQDWAALRLTAHRMLDDMFDQLSDLRDAPVWQKLPEAKRVELRGPLPVQEAGLTDIYEDYQRLIQPYSVGNLHPGFMGWVHGGGNPVGMLAEMLAGG